MKTATNSLPDAKTNATVSAKVLRLRSRREKCPSAARPAKRPLADLDPEPAPKTSTPSQQRLMQPSTEDPEDAIQFSIHRKSVLQLWTNPDQTEEQIGSTESCKVGV